MATCVTDLKESNEFLNLLLANINSAVLIVDENLQIHQVNDFFVELFDTSLDRFVEKSFGQIAGCVNAVRENKPCGKTSQCGRCILRKSLLHSMVAKVPADKVTLDRVFFTDGKRVRKHLEFSTRPIEFEGKALILVIIYDVTDIEQKNRELERKQHLIDQDLQAAAGIQQSLLPVPGLKIPNLAVDWHFAPCEQIGGDIFNLQMIDHSRVGFYMIDVCGHGVPAALVAVSVSQFLKSNREYAALNRETQPPQAILQGLNAAFPFSRFESFFSMVYATIDHGRGRLTYSCAGHPPLIVIAADGGVRALGCHGPVIGLDEELYFDQHEQQLHSGDKIVFYTDGILECRNSAGDILGTEQFIAILARHAKLDVGPMVAAVTRDVKTYLGVTEPDDDISLMIVAYQPQTEIS